MTDGISVSASVRLRPTRIGFLVRPDNLESVRRVMQVCTCLWGGSYNPIIPVCSAIPEVWADHPLPDPTPQHLAQGYIAFFEPDVFVEAEPGLANEIALPAGRLEIGEPRTIPLDAFLNRDRDTRPQPFGTNIFDVYRSLYEREFRFVSRDRGRVAFTSSEGENGAFVDAALGGFPPEGSLAALRQSYDDAFKPELIPATAEGFIRIIKENFQFPLNFTRHGLKRDYGGRGRDEPLLFVVDPDSPLDLVDLWNLRLFHWQVIPINMRWFHESRKFIAAFVREGYRLLPGNRHGLFITPTIQFGRSIAKEHAQALAQQAGLTTLEGCRWAFKLWYDPIWQSHTDDTVVRPQPVQLTADAADHQLTTSGDAEHRIVFASLAPDFAPTYADSSARWANVVNLRSYSSDDRLALVLPSSFNDVEGALLRLGDPTFISREGFVLPHRFIGSRNYLRVTTGGEAIAVWLKAHGVDATPSEPGRITEQVLRSIGGIRGAALLVDRDTLKLLDDMAKSVRRFVDGTIEVFEDRAVPVNRFKELVQRRLNAGPYYWISLDAFVKANVIRLGLSVTCPNCTKKNWISITAMAETLNCERCLCSFPFPQGTLEFDRTPWQYRVVGPFSIPGYAGGAYATVLALRLFSDKLSVGDADLTYATGLDIKGIAATPIEVDFTCWHRRREMIGRHEEPVLIFGEAKSFAERSFKTADIERMAALADKFPGAFIVFATLKDELNDDERAGIGALATKGRERLRDGNPRSPVIVLTGTELFAGWHLEQAWKEKGGMHAQFVEPAHVRLDNLWTLAEFTQQLYLGLPNPWAHLRAPSRSGQIAGVPPDDCPS